MRHRKLGLRPAPWVLGLLIGAACPALAEPPAPAPGSPGFPAYVMGKIDDLYRGASSHGQMEMQVQTQHWSRKMVMDTWSLRLDYTLVRILEPLKERGTATLKARGDLFIYLNKTGRTVKITSGMMGGSWMGSHFTNDDLLHQSRLSRDYEVKLADPGAPDRPTYRFTLKAKPNAAVVWDRLEVTVRRSDLQPLIEVFYDEEGRKMRRLEFSEHREVGGRVMPMQMLMRPLDKPDEWTRVTWKQIDFGVKLDEGFFTLQRLRAM